MEMKDLCKEEKKQKHTSCCETLQLPLSRTLRNNISVSLQNNYLHSRLCLCHNLAEQMRKCHVTYPWNSQWVGELLAHSAMGT